MPAHDLPASAVDTHLRFMAANDDGELNRRGQNHRFTGIFTN
jgi:hypothetical protein